MYIPVLSFNSVDSGTSGLVKAVMSPHDYSGTLTLSYCIILCLCQALSLLVKQLSVCL